MHNLRRAQTLIVVIAMLAVLFIIGAAFFIFSQTERVSSKRHLDVLRARYIADSGVVFAAQVLKQDKQTNSIDSLSDKSFTYFSGTEVDLNSDSQPEAKWIELKDLSGKAFGRFAVRISDEMSKINLNYCTKETLANLFSRLGLNSAKVDTLIEQRPFDAVEQVAPLLGQQDFKKARDYLTVYGQDKEVDLEGQRRIYLNTPSSNLIMETFLSRGSRDPFQKAANFKDAADSDYVQTVFDAYVLSNLAPTLTQPGNWQRVPIGFYQAPAGGAAGTFSWSNLALEDADYYCYLYSSFSGDTIGDVYVDKEENAEPIRHGEGLSQPVHVSGGSFSLNIRPSKDTNCRFSYIELASRKPQNGLNRKIIRGTEALVINEIMVSLKKELITTPVTIDPEGSYTWTFEEVRPGDYYVAVLAENSGGFVGDMRVNSQISGEDLSDGDYLSGTLSVTDDKRVRVEIVNRSLKTATFKGLKLSQQPDAEFIEVLNLSPQEIDLSGFSFEVDTPAGDLVNGWPASVPAGTKLAAYGYLVFAFDNSDSASSSPKKLAGNKICFRNLWGFDGASLIFDDREIIDQKYDLLPDSGAQIIFKDARGETVDCVRYRDSQITNFVSLERPDPTATKLNLGNDGLFDGWQNCIDNKEATPGRVNENWGMYVEKVKHTPVEINVFNRNFTNLSEMLQLSSGESWKKFEARDAVYICDRISYEPIDCDLKGHYLIGDFQEGPDDTYSSLHKGESGTWQFPQVAAGDYLLSIIAKDSFFSGERIEVSLQIDDGDFSPASELLFKQGFALYGSVELNNSPTKLKVKIINGSDKEISLRKVRLEPVYAVNGRLNVNTASVETLCALLGEGLAASLINNRPLGLKDNRKLGLGDIAAVDAAALAFLNKLTLRSDTYEIFCRGEYLVSQEAKGRQEVRSVLQRGE